MTQMSNTDMPLVSIIIPTFNSASYVGDAITSALSQTYSNLEVIVVDDGSTDNTLEILRTFGDKICWETLPHGGAPKARNRGLEISRGEIIQYFDSDDLLYPEKIAIQAKALIETGATSAFSWGVEIQMNQPDEAPVPYTGTADPDPVIAALGTNPGTGAGLHLKRALLEIDGFREDLPCAQDRDLHLRLAAKANLWVFQEQPLLTSRRRVGSVSSSPIRVYQQYAKFIPPFVIELQSNGRLTPIRRKAISKFLAMAAQRCARGGDWNTAKEYFRSAQELDPAGISSAFGPVLGAIASILGPIAACQCSQFAKRLRR